MSYRVLEELSGKGTLYEGDRVLGPVSYNITVYENVTHVGTMGSESDVSGMNRIEASITGADCFDLMQRNVKVTLEIEDGRRWNFYVKDMNGTLMYAG